MYLIHHITIDSKTRIFRKRAFYAFIACFLAMIRYLVQHEIYHVLGASSWYALFEWAMVGIDIAFDWKNNQEFAYIEFQFWGPGLTLMREV
jgi:hypothetical protein